MVVKINFKEHSDVSNKIVGTDEVERLIEDYGHKDSNPAMADKLGYLRSARTITKVRIISFPLANESRVSAIIREYKAYLQMKPENYTHFVFCIEYSMHHPLLMDEEQRLRAFLQALCPTESNSIIFSAVDESLKERILVTIICSN